MMYVHICVHVHVCGKGMHMPGICMESEGQRANLGAGPHLPLCLKQGLGMARFLTVILALLEIEIRGLLGFASYQFSTTYKKRSCLKGIGGEQ